MMRLKLLQCGDFHLDAPFSSLSDMDGKPEQRRHELRQALIRTVDLAEREKVDMLLICGDLYEHRYIRKSTINFICEQFSRIPGIPVLIIPGNHDPAVPGSLYCYEKLPLNVHILAGSNCMYLDAASGASVRTFGTAEAVDRSRINIFMHHGTLDMEFNTDAFQPVSSAGLDKAGYDYCALGHFHSRIENAGGTGRIFNAGSPEPLGFDEEGDHGVFIATIEKQNNESVISHSFHKVGIRRFINTRARVDGCSTDEQAAVKAAEAIEAAGGSADLYRVTLEGYIPHDIRLNTVYITDMLKDRAFYLKIINNAIPDYDFGRISKEQGLRGLFARKMLERAANASDEEAKSLIMQALYFGLEAIDEGRVCL